MWDIDDSSEAESTASDSSYHKVQLASAEVTPPQIPASPPHRPTQEETVEASPEIPRGSTPVVGVQPATSPVASIDSASSYEVLARDHSGSTDDENDTETEADLSLSQRASLAKQVAESVVQAALEKAVSEAEDLPSPPVREKDPRSPPRPRPPTPRPPTPTTTADTLEEIELRVFSDTCATARTETVNPVAMSPETSFATCLALVGGAVGEEADDLGETSDVEREIETLQRASERQSKTTESASLVELARPPWWQRFCCCFFR